MATFAAAVGGVLGLALFSGELERVELEPPVCVQAGCEKLASKLCKQLLEAAGELQHSTAA